MRLIDLSARSATRRANLPRMAGTQKVSIAQTTIAPISRLLIGLHARWLSTCLTRQESSLPWITGAPLARADLLRAGADSPR